jgi:hypothetical protein
MKVNYSIKCYTPNTTNILTKIKNGEEFDLALLVQDLRPEGTYQSWDGQTKDLIRGVFAAYCDILYNKNYSRIIQPIIGVDNTASFLSAFVFNTFYQNGKSAIDGNRPGRIDDVGAFFSGDWSKGAGVNPVEVFRVKMVATLPDGLYTTTQAFIPDFTVVVPAHYTLVFGNFAANPIEYSEVAVSEITKNSFYLMITR